MDIIYENPKTNSFSNSSSFSSFFIYFVKILFFIIISFFIVFLIHQILKHFYGDSNDSKEKIKEDLNTFTQELINKT